MIGRDPSLDAWAIEQLQETQARSEHEVHGLGLPDGDPQDAVNLNNLDDWLEFHSAEIA